MKIETQPRDDYQVTMTVVLDAEQMEGAKHRAARRISERKSIPGFRPGKAPYEVVLRNFGESAIMDEALDLLLDEVYPKALEQAKIEPGAAGSLEEVTDLDKKPKLTFKVPLAPSVELGDYRSVRLPYDWKEPDESEVDKSLEELRQMYAKTETVDRPIQKGDFVMIDLKGVDVEAAQDQQPLMNRPGLPVFVRTEEKADAFPFPGFTDELVGSSVDDSKSFSHKYEKDYKDEALAGKTVKFEVKVKMVRGSTLPELDDEFAKQVGPFESVQALRQAVKANLDSQSKGAYDEQYFNDVMEKVKAGATIKYPPQVVDHEVEHVMEDLKSRLAKQGLDLDAYLKSREMDEEKFVAEEARPIAVKRLERSLVMEEIAKAEKIEISKEELNSTFQETWGEYQGDAGFQRMIRGKSQPPKRLLDAVAMESANRAFVQATLNRLKDIATGQAPELPAEGEAQEKPAKKRTTPKKTTAKASGPTPKSTTKPAARPKKAATGKTVK